MALLFGGEKPHNVSCGVVPPQDNFSVLVLVYVTALTSGRCFWGAWHVGCRLLINGVSGDLRFRVKRATTDVSFITNDTPIALNQWMWLAATFDKVASPTSHIYSAELGDALAESTYGTSQDGAGDLLDSGEEFRWGNNSHVVPALSVTARIAVAHFFKATLDLDQLNRQAYRPQVSEDHLRYQVLGFNKTDVQPDWSGNGGNGTVTGAVVADHAPLAPPFGFNPGGWQEALGAAVVEGLEYTVPANLLHYVARENRMHYTAIANRLHFTVVDEDS